MIQQAVAAPVRNDGCARVYWVARLRGRCQEEKGAGDDKEAGAGDEEGEGPAPG
jgi:hypothetical protein